jgi:hypothetical protein
VAPGRSHISLKVGWRIDIGGVSAPVGGDVVQDLAHIVFKLSKNPTVPNLRSFFSPTRSVLAVANNCTT